MFLLLLPIFFVILFHHIISLFFQRQRSLPPGLTPWQLIGNILHLEKKLHISITNFAKIYSPLISLRLGTQIVIVASSPSTMVEILKHHDRLLSARFIQKSPPRRMDELERESLVWSPNCSDQWKLLRSLSSIELFLELAEPGGGGGGRPPPLALGKAPAPC